jgi:hypothetical protein
MLTGILMAGVRVVQLSPYEMVLTDKSNGWELMRAVMELSRGHGESALKSKRNGDAWDQRRKNTRAKGALLTLRLPAWVECRGGKLRPIAARAAAVRRVFTLAAAGYGNASIVKKLTAEKVPPFGVADHWSRTYVALLLTDRRALGELQPRLRDGEPDGPPIKNYFPPVVSEAEFQAARTGAAQRQKRMGRGRRWTPEEDELIHTLSAPEAAKRLKRSRTAVHLRRHFLARRKQEGKAKKPAQKRSRHINIFSGLLRDARDGNSYYAATRSSKLYGTRWRVLLNVASAEGRATASSFPFGVFESAVLEKLREISPQEILNGGHEADEVMVLASQRVEVEGKIAELEAELLRGDVAALARVLRQLEARKRDLVEREVEAQQRAAHPLGAAWGEAHTLIDVLEKSPDPDDIRRRLRTALLRMVESIWLLVVARGRTRICAAQIWFAGGKRQRSLLVLHTPHSATFAGKQPGRRLVATFADVVRPSDLDLRRRDHAARLEKVLAALDLSDIGR